MVLHKCTHCDYQSPLMLCVKRHMGLIHDPNRKQHEFENILKKVKLDKEKKELRSKHRKQLRELKKLEKLNLELQHEFETILKNVKLDLKNKYKTDKHDIENRWVFYDDSKNIFNDLKQDMRVFNDLKKDISFPLPRQLFPVPKKSVKVKKQK